MNIELNLSRTCLQVMRFLIWSHEDWAEDGGGGDGVGFWCFFLRLLLRGFFCSEGSAKEVKRAMKVKAKKVMKISLFLREREREIGKSLRRCVKWRGIQEM